MLRDDSYRRIWNHIHQLKKFQENTTDLMQKVELTNRIHNLQQMLLISGERSSNSS